MFGAVVHAIVGNRENPAPHINPRTNSIHVNYMAPFADERKPQYINGEVGPTTKNNNLKAEMVLSLIILIQRKGFDMIYHVKWHQKLKSLESWSQLNCFPFNVNCRP